MKYILLFSFLIYSGVVYSQTYTLVLTIAGINAIEGEIVVNLFNKEDYFLEEGKEFRKARFKVTGDTEKYVMDNLPIGDYTISILHDANSDGECNLNFFGIPLEGYGFSNNFRPTIAAPVFDDCVFDVQSDTAIEINLIY